MKILTVVLVLLATAAICFAGKSVTGYAEKNPTKIKGFASSSSDASHNSNAIKGYSPYKGELVTDSSANNERSPEYNNKTFGNPDYVESGNNDSDKNK